MLPGRHLLGDTVDAIEARFPTFVAACRSAGLSPDKEWVPVSPTTHYTMGGVLTDADGRTTLEGLMAVGEVASSGLHGANRLASNSLLEGAVMGRRAAQVILGTPGPVAPQCGCPRSTKPLVWAPLSADEPPLGPPVFAAGYAGRGRRGPGRDWAGVSWGPTWLPARPSRHRREPQFVGAGQMALVARAVVALAEGVASRGAHTCERTTRRNDPEWRVRQVAQLLPVGRARRRQPRE